MSITYDPAQFQNDPEKARSRAELLEYILQKFPDPNMRKNLRALFLTGTSLAEYHDIFKPAGLTPQNITGIDASSEAISRCENERSKLPESQRIHLKNETVHQHVSTPNQKPYDIVFLDFDVNYGRTVSSSIADVFTPKRDVLSDHSLLYVGMQARREQAKQQWRLLTMATMPVLEESLQIQNELVFLHKAGTEDKASLDALTKQKEKWDAKVLPSFYLIYELATQNDFAVPPRFNGEKEIFRRAILGEIITAANRLPIVPIDKGKIRYDCEQLFNGTTVDAEIATNFKTFLDKNFALIEHLGFENSTNDPLAKGLLACLFNSFTGLYQTVFTTQHTTPTNSQKKYQQGHQELVRDALKYSIVDEKAINYISSSRCPMQGAVCELQRNSNAVKLLHTMMDYTKNPKVARALAAYESWSDDQTPGVATTRALLRNGHATELYCPMAEFHELYTKLDQLGENPSEKRVKRTFKPNMIRKTTLAYLKKTNPYLKTEFGIGEKSRKLRESYIKELKDMVFGKIYPHMLAMAQELDKKGNTEYPHKITEYDGKKPIEDANAIEITEEKSERFDYHIDKPKLTKDEFLALRLNGIPYRTLKNEYSGSISQWEAHVTMKTYDDPAKVPDLVTIVQMMSEDPSQNEMVCESFSDTYDTRIISTTFERYQKHKFSADN